MNLTTLSNNLEALEVRIDALAQAFDNRKALQRIKEKSLALNLQARMEALVLYSQELKRLAESPVYEFKGGSNV